MEVTKYVYLPAHQYNGVVIRYNLLWLRPGVVNLNVGSEALSKNRINTYPVPGILVQPKSQEGPNSISSSENPIPSCLIPFLSTLRLAEGNPLHGREVECKLQARSRRTRVTSTWILVAVTRHRQRRFQQRFHRVGQMNTSSMSSDCGRRSGRSTQTATATSTGRSCGLCYYRPRPQVQPFRNPIWTSCFGPLTLMAMAG